MTESIDREGRFTILDGVALVVAAAIASVHMQTAVRMAVGAGWGLVWLTFAGVGLTSSGSILFLSRRYGRKSPGYPRTGDRLWALLGVPWVITAALRPATSSGFRAEGALATAQLSPQAELYEIILGLTIAGASILTLATLWRRWVKTGETETEPATGSSPWSHHLGLALAVAWPLQWAFLLVVLDSESSTLMR